MHVIQRLGTDLKTLDGFFFIYALVFSRKVTKMKRFYMFLNKLEREVIKIYKFLSLYDYFFVNRARALCIIFFNTLEL